MTRPTLIAATAALAALALAGCSTHTTGSPTTAPPPSTDLVPPVTTSRDLTGFVDRPCELLTPTQLGTLRIAVPGRPDTVGFEGNEVPGCVWIDYDSDRRFSLWTDIGIDILGNVYAQRDSFATFEIIDLDGHPAIVKARIANSTTCLIDVEAAEKQTLTVSFTSLVGAEESCGPVREAAAAVLQNLPLAN